MISGSKLWRGTILIACLLASPASAQLPPKNWGLPQLMAGLASVKSASARFTEVKTMAVLNAPLVTSGTLDYTAPDRMRKITVSPTPERFVLAGGQITIQGGQDNQTHVFSTRESPLIGGLTDGILDALAGNLPALSSIYRVGFSGGPAAWQLVLQPRDAAMTRFISWMCIRGSENRISDIATESANGDHSDMSVTETVNDAR